MDYCSSCEEEFFDADLFDISDPFTGETFGYHCESCDEAAGEATQEALHG
jgi:hypothetical protein